MILSGDPWGNCPRSAFRDKTEAAYRRGALLVKRRELMEAWAAWLGVVASGP